MATREMKPNQVRIFDTTLRDGEQSPGASMDRSQKVQMALQLEKLGVDIIEAGFPIASNDEFEAVKAVAKAVREPVVAGLCRTTRGDIDRAWEALQHARRARIHTFIATSDIHLKYKLKMSRKDVLREARAAVRHARRYCEDVEFSPEDATRSDWDYLVEVVKAAIDEGATTINLPDTVGYIIPAEFARFWDYVFERVPAYEGVVFSAHCHNDLGLAVANSLVAVEKGCRQVECTVNGIGERAGNASLEEIVMALEVRGDCLPFTTRIRTQEIYPSSRLLSAITGLPVQPNKAVVGKNAFAHEAGIHQHGVISRAITYEIMTPQSVGRPSNTLVLGKHSGRHGLRKRYEELGVELSKEELQALYLRFTELADKKKEVFDEDLLLLLREGRAVVAEHFVLDYLQTTSGSQTVATATVRVKVGGETKLDSASGDGPVAATFHALGRITGIPCKLTDYTVNAVTRGGDAVGEVHLSLDFGDRVVGGRSSSTDIIEASAKAYLSAVNKYLLARTVNAGRKGRKGKQKAAPPVGAGPA